MPDFITLAEVLKTVDSGQPFDIEVVTADVKRGTGGAIRSYKRHVKFVKQHMTKAETAKFETLRGTAKDARHYENSTRNIYDTQKREVRKIHIRLIVIFNGKHVI